MAVNNPLETLKTQLKKLKDTFNSKYLVPALWCQVGKEPQDGRQPLSVNPGAFYLSHIEAIEKNAIKDLNPMESLNGQLPDGQGGNWIEKECIYNMFVRLTTAYDHNGDGALGGSIKDVTRNLDGVRESGTFLKAIAMLGYIKALGCTVIHLLPITSIGKAGNKGDLGSPYGIKNPYKLEKTLADPLVNMGVEDQFKAFILCAHMLGIRVICEFAFRTQSKDGDWIQEHPEWFYWIDSKIEDRAHGETDLEKAKATYGNPLFPEDQLDIIKTKVESKDFNNLPAPSDDYVNCFKIAPDAKKVRIKDDGHYEGFSVDPKTGEEFSLRIPGAFADWPPDDNQPPWGDVTYFKMYLDEDPNNPEFNYIAYNTIRMYDNKLARPELANKPLWDAIIEVIPSYQEKYGIDGVMIDMGHAVPVALMKQLIARAREIDPNFCFLSENFEIGQASVDAGYNAVFGYCWWVEYKRDEMYNMLRHLGEEGVPLAYFGAIESHNCPRACSREGGYKYAKYAFLTNSMLPRAIPFIHSGQELDEVDPVNTGLDFSNQMLEALKGKKLALFDLCSYKWDDDHGMLNFTRKVLELRKKYASVIVRKDLESFCKLMTGYADVVAFMRGDESQRVLVLFNRDFENSYKGELDISWCNPNSIEVVKDALSNERIVFKVEDNKIKYDLKPGQSCFFAW